MYYYGKKRVSANGAYKKLMQKYESKYGNVTLWRGNGTTTERQFPSMTILTVINDSIPIVTGTTLHPKNLIKQ